MIITKIHPGMTFKTTFLEENKTFKISRVTSKHHWIEGDEIKSGRKNSTFLDDINKGAYLLIVDNSPIQPGEKYIGGCDGQDICLSVQGDKLIGSRMTTNLAAAKGTGYEPYKLLP